MPRVATLLSLTLAICLGPVNLGFAHVHEPIRVLLMTGQNNHDWKATTPVLVKMIEDAGRFKLEVNKEPWSFGPDAFAECDVVVSNWSVWPKVETDPWSAETKAAFLGFIKAGGGLVVIHAGSSTNYEFPEFQALVGKTWMKDETWHGAKHEFEVSFTEDHPVTNGLKPFKIFDELWRDMVKMGEFEVLANADTSGDSKKQGPPAPMLMTTKLGEGRGVNLVLGHDTRSMANPHFQELLLRSIEWAATGDVHEPFNTELTTTSN